jgi:hypothetical protein
MTRQQRRSESSAEIIEGPIEADSPLYRMFQMVAREVVKDQLGSAAVRESASSQEKTTATRSDG